MANATSLFHGTSVVPLFREAGWTAGEPNGLPYFEAALLLPLVVLVWETYIDVRQRRHLHDTRLPPQLADAFALIEKPEATTPLANDDEPAPEPALASAPVTMRDKYDQSRAYGLDKLSLELVSRTVRQCIATGLLLVGFFPYAWTLSGYFLEWIGLDPHHEVSRTLVFFTITLLRDALVELPFSLYSTFVVEARHGFNKMTLRVFFVEALKLGFVVLLFGYPIVTVMVVVVRWAGDLFFVYAPIAWAVLMTIFFGLSPAIVPFFEKVTPLEEGALHAKIHTLAASQQFPVSSIVVSDNSTTSNHSNASIIGIGATKTIYLDDTLLAAASDEEVLAVLCHEFGHSKKWHVPRALLWQGLSQFVKLYVFGRCMNDAALYAGFGFASQADTPHALIIGYTIFSAAVWVPLERVLAFTSMATSRKYEFEADEYATNLGHGEALKTGLIRLLVQNLATLNPDPLYSLYHFHHPSLLERLDAITNRMKKQE